MASISTSSAAFRKRSSSCAAYEIEPESPGIRGDFQAILVHAGRVAEARAIVEDSLRREPNSARTYQALANVLTAEGRHAEALEADIRARLINGEPLERIDALRRAFAADGRRGVLRLQREWLQRQLEADAANLPFGLATNLAYNAVALGEWQDAIRWLEVAADRGEDGPLKLNAFTQYPEMAQDLRFQALRRRVGLDR
jgi:tetratricopeptide (TPR) repeat protein